MEHQSSAGYQEHLDDIALSDAADGLVLDGSPQAQHLQNCALCSARVADAGPPLAAEEAPAAEALSRLTSVRVHEGLPPFPEGGTAPDIAPGQLWRLRWNDASLLAVTIAQDDPARPTTVEVAPVTGDIDKLDPYELVVPADASRLCIDLAVWLSLEGSVPPTVFDVCFGDTAEPAALLALRASRRRRESAPGGSPGRIAGGPADDIQEFRDVLIGILAVLADAQATAVSETPEISLAQRIRDADIALRPLVAAVGDVGVAMSVRRGDTVALTPTQAAGLGTLLGVPTEVVSASTTAPPAGLVNELAQPKYRPALIRKARASGRSEHQVRLDLCRSPIAARGNSGEQRDWTALASLLLAGEESR